MRDTNPHTGRAVPAGSDCDPAPRNGAWVLTDFSELAQFQFSEVDCTFSLADEGTVVPEPGLPPMRPVERVQRSIVTQKRLGHQRWFEVANVTIIRNARPSCG